MSLVLHPSDDVEIVTAPTEIGGTRLTPGHKLARHPLATGAAVRKFGQVIGYATTDIATGDHVHSHNCAFGAHDQDYRVSDGLDAARAALPAPGEATFQGYRRANGQVGTRNYIALVATVNCSGTVIRRAAEILNARLADEPAIDGVVAFAHGSGCGMAQTGTGADFLSRVLWGHATHPNVGAAVFVGLGCEVFQVARMKQAYGGNPDRFHGLTIQDNGGTAQTIDTIVARVMDLVPEVASARRTPCPASELKVALQCGGSDGLSGITANPALGVASDMLAALGGSPILAETPEIYGAEQLLLSRAADGAVADKLIERVRWWEAYTEMHGGSMDNNPSPGNKAGGLTTILEKSLGAVAKAGQGPLASVVDYAAPVTTPGLCFMDSPGFDPVSVTGQIAGGAQVVVFTTGRGSAFGSKPAPTIKLATNDALWQRMEPDMDINCGDVVSAQVPLADKGREIFDMILRVASGEATKSEALGLGDNEFVPWQVGAVM
ncbi:hydrolase, UxaA family protein [Oceanicola granulosus HTCC2516]|uniref:Hydrolase, UxaA family protein n=1 Tax=Oceanicola granulosus (strain ATCC BAA-861 / DSM 15982 / KCTC 12143 / HTCC2516) TaxID=314256 RepID=Q2CCW6_OCEGH|nr:altronate dehydratase family protein [Oceanicola granulosus]EAR50507.1 hydrolase, UxaA family protein [Oceanicola granulosus HTCC2516]